MIMDSFLIQRCQNKIYFTVYDDEICKKLVGARCTFKNVDIGNDKIFVHFTFDGVDELNSTAIFDPAGPNAVNFPHLGGESIVKYKETEKGRYETVIETKKFGKFSYNESYDEEGVTFVIIIYFQ